MCANFKLLLQVTEVERRQPARFVATPYRYHEEKIVDIEDLNHQGHGVGRDEGWVITVPYALPGEQVRARVWCNHQTYSEADLIEVIRPSSDRIAPICSLFGHCGGCQFQNLSYEAQLHWKHRLLLNSFLRAGVVSKERVFAKGPTEPDPTKTPERATASDDETVPFDQGPASISSISPVVPSPQSFGYRTKLTPHYPKHAEVLGFERWDSRKIVDVPQCPLATDDINQALATARTKELPALAQRTRGGTLLFRQSNNGVVRDSKDEVEERVGSLTLRYRAGDFFQTNPFLLPQLIEHVVDEARATGIDFLVDVYCGVGLFALAASQHVKNALGVEISESSVVYARKNAERNRIRNCRFEVGDAGRMFSLCTFPAKRTAVIIDPPRKGCDADFLHQLLRFEPLRIIYVSCNPATQARDLLILQKGGYRLSTVQPFDMFPQTKHLECAVTMELIEST